MSAVLTQAARDRIGRDLDGLGDPHNFTGPIVADGLGQHVDVLARFGIVNDPPAGEWTITVIDDLGPFVWVARWDRLRLYVGDRGSVDLALYVLRARAELRRSLREQVIDFVETLGLPRRMFLKGPR